MIILLLLVWVNASVAEQLFYSNLLFIRILSIQLLFVTQFVFCRPIQFLNLTILQNHSVNILSTINAFPHPKVFGSIIHLFVNHHATTPVAFRKSFPHHLPLGKRKYIRIVETKILKIAILSILKMGL